MTSNELICPSALHASSTVGRRLPLCRSYQNNRRAKPSKRCLPLHVLTHEHSDNRILLHGKIAIESHCRHAANQSRTCVCTRAGSVNARVGWSQFRCCSNKPADLAQGDRSLLEQWAHVLRHGFWAMTTRGIFQASQTGNHPAHTSSRCLASTSQSQRPRLRLHLLPHL